MAGGKRGGVYVEAGGVGRPLSLGQGSAAGVVIGERERG